VAKCRSLVGMPGALPYVQQALAWAEHEFSAEQEREEYLIKALTKAKEDREAAAKAHEAAERALAENAKAELHAQNALDEHNQKKRKTHE